MSILIALKIWPGDYEKRPLDPNVRPGFPLENRVKSSIPGNPALGSICVFLNPLFVEVDPVSGQPYHSQRFALKFLA